MVYTPDRRRFLASLGSTTAAAAASCGILSRKEEIKPIATASRQKQPLPTPIPEILPSLETPQGTLAWVLSMKQKLLEKNPATERLRTVGVSAVWAGDVLYFREPTGTAVAIDPKDRRVIWRLNDEAYVGAADQAYLAVFSRTDATISILDARTKKRVAAISPDLPGLPRDKIIHYFLTPQFVGDLLVVPNKDVVDGVFRGFAVYEKSTGQRIWGAPKTDHFSLLEVTNNTILAALKDRAMFFLFDTKTGNRVAEIPATKKPLPQEEWVYRRHDNLLITIGKGGFDQPSQAQQFLISIHDMESGRKITERQFSPGNYESFWKPSGVCDYHCNSEFNNIMIRSRPNPRDPNNKLLEIHLETPIKPERYFGKYGYSIFNLNPATGDLVDNGGFAMFPDKVFVGGNADVSFRRADNYTTFFPYRGRGKPYDIGNQGSVRKNLTVVSNGAEASYGDLPATGYIGKFGEIVVMKNWGEEAEGYATSGRSLFGLNPAERRVVWTRPLSGVVFTHFVRGNNLYVISETLQRIDTATGVPEVIGFIGGGILKIIDADPYLLVETADNRLIAFHLP